MIQKKRSIELFDIPISLGIMKAFIHALIMPVVIGILTYFFIKPALVIILATAYLLFATAMYKNLEKRFPKYEEFTEWFHYFSLIWLALATIWLIFIFSGLNIE